MNAIERFAEFHDRIEAQQARLFGPLGERDIWAGPVARLFRFDPRRQLTPNLEAIAQYLRPEDVFVDVGGGAGRVGLPMALRCRQVISVEPSPAMRAEFTASAAEAGIQNATLVPEDWLDADNIAGDVVFSADVVYFVRDIASFRAEDGGCGPAQGYPCPVECASTPPRPPPLQPGLRRGNRSLQLATRSCWRRSGNWAFCPTSGCCPNPPGGRPSCPKPGRKRCRWPWRAPGWRHQTGSGPAVLVESRFDELFRPGPEGYAPLWRGPAPMKELLITWATD